LRWPRSRHDAVARPLGGQSEIKLSSDWPHPNLIGSPLPAKREISQQGFSGTWSINHLATGIPLSWRGGEFNLDTMSMNYVGVALTEPGDVHQQTDRIVKYGMLVVTCSCRWKATRCSLARSAC
jgi:inner membrane protein